MSRTKILLADSDARRSSALVPRLQQDGIDVVSTNDAVHTLSVARQAKPDVLVIHAQLAGGGAAAARRLRSNVFTAHMPVIGLASSAAEQRGLLEAGARACLDSPVDPKTLVAAVGRHGLQSLDFTQAPAVELEAPARMRELEDLGLLDTPPEEAFDRLTRVATRLLNTPTALVTLIAKDRQFFKSQVGLPQPWAGMRQTRLSHSFCQWVVSGKEAVVVSDARIHPVLKSNLAIQDLGVTAYAGVPLAGPTGEAIGSMCAIDSQSRSWQEAELATLGDLGKIVQAYALLRPGTAQGRPAGAAALSLHVAANAIAAATRILRRHERIDADVRADLLHILEEQSGQLLRLTGPSDRRPAASA